VSGGEFGHERGERLALVRCEGCEEVGVLRLGGAAQGAEHLAAGVGDVEAVMPAILGVAAARDEAGLLQGVDQHHHAAGSGAQAGGERALAEAGLTRQDPQHARRGRGEAGRFDELAEAGGREGAQLRDQEPGTGGAASGVASGAAVRAASGGHPFIITPLTE